MAPTPVFLPGKSHERRSLIDYSPWGHKELDILRIGHFKNQIIYHLTGDYQVIVGSKVLNIYAPKMVLQMNTNL